MNGMNLTKSAMGTAARPSEVIPVLGSVVQLEECR